MLELFVIGSETVVFYKGSYYVTGPGYEFRVVLSDNTYHITGRPRYEETFDFLDSHLNIVKDVK